MEVIQDGTTLWDETRTMVVARCTGEAIAYRLARALNSYDAMEEEIKELQRAAATDDQP